MQLEIKDIIDIIPGITIYRTSSEQAKEVLNIIKTSLDKLWQPASVYSENIKIDNEIRKCYNYILSQNLSYYAPDDPLRQVCAYFENGFELIKNDFEFRNNIVHLISESVNLLKYEVGGMFVKHMDDSWATPRTASLSMILNDDYEGGEFEFNKFGLKIKSEAGDVIMFCASFPYQHEIHPVLSGVRYSAVKWFRFKNEH